MGLGVAESEPHTQRIEIALERVRANHNGWEPGGWQRSCLNAGPDGVPERRQPAALQHIGAARFRTMGRNHRKQAGNGVACLIRRDRAKRSEDAPDVMEEFFAGSPQDALNKELSEALRSLNLTDRQLVSLVVFEGYTLASAAKLLAITPSAAKTRMHRARQRMKLSVEHSYVPAMEGNQS